MRTTLRAVTLGGLLSLGLAASALPSGAAGAARATPKPTRRVDLEHPIFSHPTRITNRLFPIAHVDQALMFGAEADVSLRQEVTLLDRTKTISWAGQEFQAVVSQFVAHGDGQIVEVATDYFAQADDGSVWYLGEDVTSYADGLPQSHEGSWLAGREGPGGMIMPAHPSRATCTAPRTSPAWCWRRRR